MNSDLEIQQLQERVKELEYEIKQTSANDTINLPINLPINFNDVDKLILKELKSNPNVTYQIIANNIKKSRETVRAHLKKLIDLQIVSRIGSNKTGSWRINISIEEL